MRRLTATLSLTLAVLLGGEVRGSDLPECEGSPLIGVPGDVTSWNDCLGSFQWYEITYRGGWKRGKRHGYGSTIFPNGDKYEGNRSYGLRDGPGIYFYADGRLQEGIWKNGKFRYAQKVSPTITAGKSPPPSKSAAKKENERLRKEIARLKGNLEAPSLTESSNIQEAKKECAELGFKTGTEKFGECVLQLTE